MNIEKTVSPFKLIGNSVKKFIVDNKIVSFNNPSDYQKQFDVEYEIKIIYEKDNEWIGVLQLHTDVSIKHHENAEEYTELYLIIEGFFTADIDSMPKDEFEKMLSLNGCATLYSIARAIIMTTSSQIFNSGNITLPMINVIKLKKELQNDTERLTKEVN